MKKKDIRRELGRIVKAYRKLHGLTGPQLARAAKLSKGSISKIENGNGNPSIVTLERLARALDVKFHIGPN